MMTDNEIDELAQKINNADDDEALRLWRKCGTEDVNDALRLHQKVVWRILKACKVPEETWGKSVGEIKG